MDFLKFRIPTKFELGGQTITVVLKDGMSKTDAHGLSRYDEGEIWMDNNLKPEDLKAITFYHELIHMVFNTLGQETLRDTQFSPPDRRSQTLAVALEG